MATAASGPTYDQLAAPRNAGRFIGLIKDLKPGETRVIEFTDDKDEQRKRNGLRSIGRTRGIPLVTRKHDGKLYVVYLSEDDYEANGLDADGKVIEKSKAATPFDKSE